MPRSKFIFEPYYYPFDPNQLVTIPQFFTKKECKKIIKMGDKSFSYYENNIKPRKFKKT